MPSSKALFCGIECCLSIGNSVTSWQDTTPKIRKTVHPMSPLPGPRPHPCLPTLKTNKHNHTVTPILSCRPIMLHCMHAVSSSCDDLLLEGEIRETQTQELKGMLSTIAKHIKRLIMAAENRAVTGESPCPTARGGLGLIPATTISGAPSTPGRYDGGMSADVAICDGAGGGREALRRRVSASTVAKMANAEAAAGVLNASPKSTSNAPASNATDEVLARTRVLRRASSVRQLFLGTTRRGERLAYFSRQIGLPHDTVVACFEVRCDSPGDAHLPDARCQCPVVV